MRLAILWNKINNCLRRLQKRMQHVMMLDVTQQARMPKFG